MPDLIWFELFPPTDLDLAAITNMLRPLASRPRLGILGRTPTVVFESWSDGERLRWLLGVEPLLASSVPSQLQAQLPNLGVVRLAEPNRPDITVAVDLHLHGLANPLRLDVASAVSSGVLHVLALK